MEMFQINVLRLNEICTFCDTSSFTRREMFQKTELRPQLHAGLDRYGPK